MAQFLQRLALNLTASALSLAVPNSQPPYRAMTQAPVRLTLITLIMLCGALTGCLSTAREDAPPNPTEQVLIEQLTRDPFVIIDQYERDEFEHLIITTIQGSVRVRYIIKPIQPGNPRLNIHKINDRSNLDISESDQLGTFQQPSRFR